MKKIEYWFNNVYYEDSVANNSNLTIFQKSSEKGVELPCFCYHESLSIAGNCRMCLVEINTSLKLVVACAMPLTNGVKIYTSTNRVRRAREAVIEFLLINHPLDCPICDRGGECDLQDLTLIYGSDKSRYYEHIKRAVFDKDCGSLVKMVMTRCIHCTRCIRFLEEIGGSKQFGMLGRGNNSEISTFVLKHLTGEISANIIDLCPVGALTSKPYTFSARPWELNNLEAIDIMDSMCSNIRIDYLNNRVYRILPAYSRSLNEDWISNKARFVYDSLSIQRINFPLIKKDEIFFNVSWDILAKIFLYNLIKVAYAENSNVHVFSGFLSDIESISDISHFFNKIGSYIHVNDFFEINSDFRSNFLFNSTLVSLEMRTSFIFIGFNPRLECPLLNTRLRKCFYKNNRLHFFSFGFVNQYTNLPLISLGNDYADCLNLINGKIWINKFIFNTNQIFDSYAHIVNKKISSIAIIFGIAAVKFTKLHYVFNSFVNKHFVGSTSGIIYPFSGYLNFFEINNCYNNYNIYLAVNNFIYLHKVDERLILNLFKAKNNFFVYHGSHFDVAAKICNLFIPTLTHFEDNFNYINFEGNLLMTRKVISNNNEILTVNELFRLINIFNIKLIGINLFIGLINNKVFEYFEFLKLDFNLFIFYKKVKSYNKLFINYQKSKFIVRDNMFSSFVYNYYNMDSLSRSSKNLTLASTEYIANLNTF